MLTEHEQAELDELVGLQELGTAETSDLTRMAELQEKAKQAEESESVDSILDDMNVKELKAEAKGCNIKGYGSMAKAVLVKALKAFHKGGDKDEDPENVGSIDKLKGEGYDFLGVAPNGNRCFYNKEGKACVEGNNGMQVVGNAFAEKLLKSLKK